MIKYLLLFLISIATLNMYGQDKQAYQEAYAEINDMLQGSIEINFKKAVNLAEYAWYQDSTDFDINVNFLVDKCYQLLSANQHLDIEEKLLKNWVVYAILTDTIYTAQIESEVLTSKVHQPYTYDFEDFTGANDWSKMFVTKLLDSHTGNCHSLPYLYKILADEIGVDASIAIAPNHFYIKQYTESMGWYNTELTSQSFPIDAWLMASGYISLEAIQNGIYMQALSEKEMIALCMLDLAQNYAHQISANDGFTLQCVNNVLRYFPNNINALLLKAELLKTQFENTLTIPNGDYTITELDILKEQELFTEMQNTYLRIYDLGYKEMPNSKYLVWLQTVKEAKYNNKKLNNFNVRPPSYQKNY